jgi:CRP-like cAMP-binding protein
METLEPILAAHPFLQGLDPRHLQSIGECATKVTFEAGRLLFRGQDEATHFYLINQGQVALEIFTARRGPIMIQSLSDGDAAGWLWFPTPYHWHYDARAIFLTRALALNVKELMQRCEQDPLLGYELMKRYAHLLAVQFRVTILQLVDMYGA